MYSGIIGGVGIRSLKRNSPCSIVLLVRRMLQWQPMWIFQVELRSGMLSLAGKFMIGRWMLLLLFFQKLQSISIQRGSQDKLWWIPSKKGTFKLKDFFRALSRVEGRGFPWKSVWRTKSPPKAAFFVCRRRLGKFLLWII